MKHGNGDTGHQQQPAAVAEWIRKVAWTYRADKPFLGWKERGR
jgi:hypothetical protein